MISPANLDRIANAQEARGAKIFFRALRAMYFELANRYEQDQELIVNTDTIKAALEKYHIQTQTEAAEWQYNELTKSNRVKAMQMGMYERISQAVRTWVMLNTGASITSISHTTLNLVKQMIATGQENGYGARKIAANIRAEAKGTFTAYRATVIARTEGTRAASHGHKLGAEQWEKVTGQKKWKAWSASADARTRDAHLGMLNSLPIPGDEDFIVGGSSMSAPGDPKGGASNCVNCRCRAVYMSERIARKIRGEEMPNRTPAATPQTVPDEAKTDTSAHDADVLKEMLTPYRFEVYENYKDEYPILTKSEAVSIYEYTGDHYKHINFYNRNKANFGLNPFKSGKYSNVDLWQAFTNQINSGLAKMPKYKGDVFRGTDNLKPEDIERYKAAFESGGTHSEAGFMSTSPKLQRQFGSQAIFKIKSKNGVSVKNISAHEHEDEVLFKTDTKFKVTHFSEQKKGRYEIHLEEL